ncbi:MAG: hypothetical protein ACSLFC_14505 [Desulfuromonadales bacterium]
MEQVQSTIVRLKVSPESARIVAPGAPRDLQLAAARGTLPLAGKDLLTVLFFLCRSSDVEIRKSAVKNLREAPAATLIEILKDDLLHPQLIDLLVRARMKDDELMRVVVMHPATTLNTLLYLAGKAPSDVLERLADHQELLSQHPQLIEIIIANPSAEKDLKFKLGWREPDQVDQEYSSRELHQEGGAEADADADGESPGQTEIESLMEEAERSGLSKYQIALDLKVAEKIKMGLTGDKEWRTIMMKESNKLIQGAVMKNPRISDGEVLMVAKNKTSSDDLIRMILLNKDWVKNYEIKKALIVHPKTPPPKALRFISYLTMKDIKELAKSRQVSNIVATAARKELEHRIKKTGG